MTASSIDDLMRRAPVIPVLTIERAEDAVPLAQALAEGGLPVLEITLRTEAALAALEAIAKAGLPVIPGVGTVTSGQDLARAADAGAQFAVSPGLTEPLADAARHAAIPLLPGVATASELMRAMEQGFDRLKFFPAEASGGVAALKGFAAPFPTAKFCPTGGVSPSNAPTYLNTANVICVGGTWVAPAEDVRAGRWARITGLARTAAQFPRPGDG
ncbi:MAG: bifunctional 4-hydroxy-2-oxoglutarate aldolase/2-dehydro-3-deoxy-phosphogluconate aldolase [Pseudomonadota bacterium]